MFQLYKTMGETWERWKAEEGPDAMPEPLRVYNYFSNNIPLRQDAQDVGDVFPALVFRCFEGTPDPEFDRSDLHAKPDENFNCTWTLFSRDLDGVQIAQAVEQLWERLDRRWKIETDPRFVLTLVRGRTAVTYTDDYLQADVDCEVRMSRRT